MSPVTRLYLDANIFIRLFEGNDELSDALSTLLLTSRSNGNPFLTTSEFTLAELLVVPYRNADDHLIQLYDNWTLPNSHIEVRPIHRSVLWYAAVLRSQYPTLKLPDAIHVSSAIGFRCSHILTADKRLADIYELSHTRWGTTRGSVMVEVLRPDLTTINQLIEQIAP